MDGEEDGEENGEVDEVVDEMVEVVRCSGAGAGGGSGGAGVVDAGVTSMGAPMWLATDTGCARPGSCAGNT